jgi:hypothetical protein
LKENARWRGSINQLSHEELMIEEKVRGKTTEKINRIILFAQRSENVLL